MIRPFVPGAVLAVTLLLGGCATADPDPTAAALQQGVLEVSQASAAGDWAGAQVQLGEVAADAAAARADGRITEERYQAIVSAIDLVAAELATLSAPPPAPAEEPAGPAHPGKDEKGDKGNKGDKGGKEGKGDR